MDGMNTLRAWNLRGTEPGSGDRELDRGKMGGRAASPQGGTCSLPREGDLFSLPGLWACGLGGVGILGCTRVGRFKYWGEGWYGGVLDFRLAGSLPLRFFVGDVPKRGVCWSDGSNAGPAADEI